MGLSAVATANVGAGRGVAPAPPLFDWMGTVSGARREWDADDLADGVIGSWTDRSSDAAVMTAVGSPVKSTAGGRGRVLFNGSSNYMDGAVKSTEDALGTTTTGDWMVVMVVDLVAVSAQNTGTWDDSPILSDSGFRMGASYRLRTTDHAANGWYYDGAFTPESYRDFGPTLGGNRVVHVRKSGTSLWTGVAGVEGSVATKAGAFSGSLGILKFAANPNQTRLGNLYIKKICTKGNGLMDVPTIAALAAFVSEYP